MLLFILEKVFSRSGFHDMDNFSVLTSGPHLDATFTSENTFRSSSVGAITFNCRPLVINATLVLEDFFGRSRVSPII